MPPCRSSAGRIEHRSIRKQIEAALGEAAERTGVSKGQLRRAPGADVRPQRGRLERRCPSATATAIVAVDGDKAALTWRTGTGRDVKSVPKEVKDSHADELRRLRAESRS